TGEGAASPDGKVFGTYLHGLFTADAFRKEFLESLGAHHGSIDYRAAVENALDSIADTLEAQLDCDALLAAAR
ncbi:MAG: cobyric acid synthase CobQ, partial [Rhizobiales bacterium]|nr:cobyric acid synthase CobQ [Hyphomicrobiales bacterium]